MFGINVPFGVDTLGFRRGLEMMRAEGKQWANAMKSTFMGVFGAGAVIAAFQRWAEAMDNLDDQARKLGVNAQDLQRIGVVAEKNGSSLDAMVKLLVKLQRGVSESGIAGDKMVETFAEFGINVEEFSQMDFPAQLVELSRAFQEAEKDGKGVAMVMQLFGRGGADMIQMLQDGPDALKESLEGVATVSDHTIAQMVKFNDSIVDIKNSLTVVASYILQVFESLATLIAGAISAIISGWEIDIEAIKNSAKETWTMLKALGRGDLDEVAAAYDRLTAIRNRALSDHKENLKNTWGFTKDELANVWSTKDESEGKKRGNVKPGEDPEEAMRREERIRKLRESIAEAERKAALEMMDLEARRNSLLEERAQLQRKANNETEEGLEARKEQLEVEDKIRQVNKEIADAKEKADKKKADDAKTLTDLEDKLAETVEENRLAEMSDEERLKYLTDKRDKTLKAAKAAGKAGDKKKALELNIDAESLTGEIQDVKKSIRDEAERKRKEAEELGKHVPTIVTSSLAEVGGGGRAFSTGIDPMLRESQEQTSLLREQNRLLALIAGTPSEGGGRQPVS